MLMWWLFVAWVGGVMPIVGILLGARWHRNGGHEQDSPMLLAFGLSLLSAIGIGVWMSSIRSPDLKAADSVGGLACIGTGSLFLSFLMCAGGVKIGKEAAAKDAARVRPSIPAGEPDAACVFCGRPTREREAEFLVTRFREAIAKDSSSCSNVPSCKTCARSYNGRRIAVVLLCFLTFIAAVLVLPIAGAVWAGSLLGEKGWGIASYFVLLAASWFGLPFVIGPVCDNLPPAIRRLRRWTPSGSPPRSS